MTDKNTPEAVSYGTEIFIRIFRALLVLAVTAAVGYFVYSNMHAGSRYAFKYGLDLSGGSQLTYTADVSKIDPSDVPALMEVLRQVIEKRINVFGVSEPNVQVEESSVVSSEKAHRLIVELPGVTDVNKAIESIGKTPLLEFKLVDEKAAAMKQAAVSLTAKMGSSTGSTSITTGSSTASSSALAGIQVDGKSAADLNPYVDTGLTGRYLKSATLEFTSSNGGRVAGEPIVSIVFNDEGAALFEKITRENTGQRLAIFLDGQIISSPRINEAITGGKATISGGFKPAEAKALAQNLSFGALPVPIELASTESIGGALGEKALGAGVHAGLVGFVLLSIFMILWYRVPGIVAVMALTIYVVLMLALFQLIPVVMTAAGIAGLILSIGLAVDANVLIAERIKEELIAGKDVQHSINEGFARAWLAIRDSNTAHIIAAVVLFWFGTSLIKGFALVFGLGVVVSMLSAITISRTLLLALPLKASTKIGHFLMGSGFFK
jgi:protein-export membrane protein SecD